ncbi:MAG: DNA polymerase III subunit alpha [Betaproteobacteria bacterium TMED41]|nr:MAG: DNA polymerase III subunit alpha [Betaproteobacteria bacterium TMED41]
MNEVGFVHLRLHSEYSISDSIIKIPHVLNRALSDNQPALGLTDLGNTFAFLKFYRTAREKGVKPILGVDIWVKSDSNHDSPSRILLFCRTDNGYKRLCRLISKAWLNNSLKDRAEINFSWFNEDDAILGGKMSDDLICLSGGVFGEIGKTILKKTSSMNKEVSLLIQKYKKTFNNNFYLEVQRAGFFGEEYYIESILQFANSLELPVVATHPIQFLDKKDFTAHSARVCIANGEVLSNLGTQQRFTPKQHFLSQKEMIDLFSDLPGAITNSVEIAKKCNLELEIGVTKLPKFLVNSRLTLEEHLIKEANNGLKNRLKASIENAENDDDQFGKYKNRLNHECKIIIDMGYSSYFLIVADFINWAKSNDVPVGPGRGSGAGSLVAYCLGITDIDPLPYTLLFERFLNPERVSMPDFDIDFCQEKRQLVIDYVREKYGRESVSQIVTFGTMASRAVIRDVGRVLEMPYFFCDQLSKLVPVVQNKPLSLKDARKKEPEILKREIEEEGVRELFELAQPLEDLVRNVGMHAGGVLIAPGRLTDFCPLYQAPGISGYEGVISMFDKDDIELRGLVKFDFLGLRNLTSLAMAVSEVNRLFPTRKLSLKEFKMFDDTATYDLLKTANTIAIFQVESAGMRRYLKKLEPDCFEDIIAMLALYRPGPLNSGMVDDFILRKLGQQRIEYFHPDLKECLSPTYGVIVYQEQVMQIAQIIAGYSLGSADLLRRAMGKKKIDEMAEQRKVFLKGAKKRGYTATLATKLFDLMEKFAEYGFNKSHTAAYAVVTYQTAWLKCHYPAPFLAATLTSEMGDTDRVSLLVTDARQNGIKVLPPDINISSYGFTAVREVCEATKKNQTESDVNFIRYGLGALKGVGEAAVNNIISVRKSAPFKDFCDFCQRVDRKSVNKRAFESLIKSGALDILNNKGEDGRSELLERLPKVLEVVEQIELNSAQDSLFDEDISAEVIFNNLARVEIWHLREKLLAEKESLGFFFSGHLFDLVGEEAKKTSSVSLKNISVKPEPYWIRGIISAKRKQITRRGSVNIIEIDDGEAKVEINIFNEVFEKFNDKLKIDEFVTIFSKVENDDYSGGYRVIAEKIMDLVDMRIKFGNKVIISIKQEISELRLSDDQFNELKELFCSSEQDNESGLSILLKLEVENISYNLILPKEWKFYPTDFNLEQVKQSQNLHSIELSYS